MASTLLNGQGYSADVIETQLAHNPKDKIRGVYNRAEYLPERRKMMQQWADYTSVFLLLSALVIACFFGRIP